MTRTKASAVIVQLRDEFATVRPPALARLLARLPGSTDRCSGRSGREAPAVLAGADWSREATAATPAAPVLFRSTALACADAFVHGDGLELIHHSRPHSHQAMAVQYQLPHVTVPWCRHPDARKIIFQQQLQNMGGIPAMVPLLPHPLGSNLRRVAYHSSSLSSPTKRSSQRECPVASIPTRTLIPFSFSLR